MNSKIIFSVVVIVVVGGLLLWGKTNQKQVVQYWPETSIACLSNGHQNLALHIHSRLLITKNNQNVDIPANIGISSDCMAEVHTHDSTGEIHIESIEGDQKFALKQFFEVWGEDFDWSQDGISMTVNGQKNSEYENYIMKDHDVIEINFNNNIIN